MRSPFWLHTPEVYGRSSAQQICFCFNCTSMGKISVDRFNIMLKHLLMVDVTLCYQPDCCSCVHNVCTMHMYEPVHRELLWLNTLMPALATCVFVCVYVYATRCDQLQYCMCFRYQEIWCFCSNHSDLSILHHQIDCSFKSGYWVLSNINLLGIQSKRHDTAPLESHPTIFSFVLRTLYNVHPMCDYINHVDCIFIGILTLGNHPLANPHAPLSLFFGSEMCRACKDLQVFVPNIISEHIKTWLIMKWCVTHIVHFAIVR